MWFIRTTSWPKYSKRRAMLSPIIVDLKENMNDLKESQYSHSISNNTIYRLLWGTFVIFLNGRLYCSWNYMRLQNFKWTGYAESVEKCIVIVKRYLLGLPQMSYVHFFRDIWRRKINQDFQFFVQNWRLHPIFENARQTFQRERFVYKHVDEPWPSYFGFLDNFVRW